MTEPLDSLNRALEDRSAELQRETDYYSGERPRLVLSDRSIPSYDAIVNQSRTPWAALVVDQAAERMAVTGFRVLTPDRDDDDVEADSLCWDIWQSNHGDSASQTGFATMLLHGAAYVLVEPGVDLPLISFEHPAVVAHLETPGGRRTAAAIKRWTDGRTETAVVWTDAEVETWTKAPGRPWTDSRVPNPLGVVPVFAMMNRPDLLGGYASDLAGLYPTLDRCAQSIADRVTAQLYSSTKVRYLIGVEPELDENGEPTDRNMRLATDKLLLIENPDAKAGVFDATDLRQFIEVARSDISALAALARLPSYLLSGDMVNVSREALESLSQGMVSRVIQRQVWASPALAGAMRLALRIAGDQRVLDPRTRVEPVWDAPLPPSISETSAAAATLVGAGVLSPSSALDAILGMTPSEIDKVNQYRRVDALTQQGVQVIQSLLTEAPAPPAEEEEEPNA